MVHASGSRNLNGAILAAIVDDQDLNPTYAWNLPR